MLRAIKKKKPFFMSGAFSLTLLMALCCFTLIACGGDTSGSGEPANTGKTSAKAETANPGTTAQPAQTPQATATTPPPAVEAGWKTHNMKQYAISFPDNWGGDSDAQVFWPGGGELTAGIPDLSVHVGATPLMPGRSFDEGVKVKVRGTPTSKEKITQSGLSGFKYVWEFLGKKHLALFLIEEVGGGMRVIHFADCQAPVNEYDNQKPVFEKIINSFRFKK